jgi:Ca2+:H+ antiporter
LLLDGGAGCEGKGTSSVSLLWLLVFIGPEWMDLNFWPGAVAMVFLATLTATLVTNSGRSAWFVGVLVLMVYLMLAMGLYLLPPEKS